MPDSHVPPSAPGAPVAVERLAFGPFVFDPLTGELRRDGRRVALQPQPARVLQVLAEHSGAVVSRRQLQESLWGAERSVDSEHGLNYCILQVRRALGDEADRPTFIETIPRRGYRFLAVVSRTPGLGTAPPRPAWLRWSAVLGVSVALAGGVWLSQRREPPPVRLAVASFGREAGAAALRERVVSELVLRAGDRVAVVALAAAAPPRRAAVDMVLEGSLVSQGDRTLLAVRLLALADRSVVWESSVPVDRAASDGAATAAIAIADAVGRALAARAPGA